MAVNNPLRRSADDRLVDRLKQTGPCTWLLLALVLLLLMFPFLDASFTGRMLLGILNSTVLVAAALAASESRRTLLFAVALALPALALQWMSVVNPTPTINLILGVTGIVFYGFTIGHLVAFVLRPGAVTGNKLHGAIDAYILMGFLWAMIYVVIEDRASGSFNFASGDTAAAHHLPQLLFFSFTTLTTTGYGDTVPVTAYAQSAVVIEQLAGTFYVAILIARLAGLYHPATRGGGSPDHH